MYTYLVVCFCRVCDQLSKPCMRVYKIMTSGLEQHRTKKRNTLSHTQGVGCQSETPRATGLARTSAWDL